MEEKIATLENKMDSLETKSSKCNTIMEKIHRS